ncbi:MAG: DUF342 domain-containing protein [Lachnospiraceae bacterium]|nr:DUF342 domain-containing protein [Lachnospiraceae bacterium]
MQQKNGYFRLEQKPDGVYIRVFPAAEGGETLPVGIPKDYLDRRGITYDIVKLNEVVMKGSQEEYAVLLCKGSIIPEREACDLTVSSDNMHAIVMLYPPMDGAESITVDELRNDLRMKAVTHGINEDVLKDLFAGKIYCEDIEVATGKEPRHGTDARIEYHFETNRKAKPQENEDGSVDFHQLNALNHIKKGDILATLIPEDKGEPGEDIKGNIIKPRDVKRAKLDFGHNIELSEDKTQIISMVDGHVSLFGTKVFASNEFEVENVDNATGDIDYDGDVKVNGNVKTGFKVKASGSIYVNGVVEGAELDAGGNITIARGMNGMSRGTLNAKGYIVSKFLENATALAGSYIQSESIMNSNVQAGTEIIVNGKKGFIAGGSVAASNKITAKTLGSHLGANTNVEVGINPTLKREQNQLTKQVQDNQKTVAQIEPVLAALVKKRSMGVQLPEEQVKQMQLLMSTRAAKIDENKQLHARLDELDEIISEGANPCIIVSGDVYAGVKITILDVSKYIKNAVSYCRFIREAGDVKVTAI